MCSGRFSFLDGPMTVHRPVMLTEVMEAIAPAPGQVIVDGTFGGGGHTTAIARAVKDGGRVIAIDRDLAAVSAGRESLGDLPIDFFQANYADIPEVLAQQ